jgi:hypothetical protein
LFLYKVNNINIKGGGNMLIGHWPLNGNTNDVSRYGNNGVPTNITYAAGKIGQAGDFNGTNSLITTPLIQSTLNQEFTISAWIYIDNAANYKGVIGDHLNFRGINFCQYQGAPSFTPGFYFTYGNGSTWVEVANAVQLANSTWHHVTMILKTGTGGYGKVLVNGVQVGTTLTNPSAILYNTSAPILIGRAFNGSDRYWDGRINDARVYNHALTDMEVQEIARAKILHYSFDDMQEPTTNQANTESARTMFTHAAGTIITHSLAPEKGDGWRKMVITARGSNFRLAQFPYITHPTSTTKTYSVEIDMGTTSGYYWRGDGFSGTTNATILNNKAFVTVTTTTGSGGLALFLNNNTINTTGLNDTIFYRYYQVELKPYMTEFTPISRTGLVRDHSGFFNDSNALTEANTPRWISDSKVGGGAYQFNGSNNVIERPMLSQLGDNSFTVNMWAWFDESGVRDIMFGNFDATHDFNFEKLTNNNLRFYWDGSPDVSTGNILPIGQWCMLTAVRQRLSSTSSTIKMYLNGQSVYNSTLTVNDKTSLDGTLRIGRDQRTTTEAMKGKLDDVRVYMEPLSDKDILDLYNTKAEIEQSGILYARDFLSNNTDNEIHETGVAKFADFSTVGITDGLIGYWPLNLNTIDYSGFNRNGTAIGAFLSGGSYYFDGINDTINFGIGNTFFPLLSHTINIMFRSDGTTPTTGTNPGLFGFTFGMRGILGSNGVPLFGLFKTNGSASVTSSTSYNYHDGLWHMFTGTCDGTTIKLYLDGVYQGQASVSSFWDGFTSWPTNSWNLGRDNNDGFYYFKGNIKHHKLFNRALTEEEIKIEYNTMLNNQLQIHESGVIYATDLEQY